MTLQELDYFAPGYRYSRTTILADVQQIPLQSSSLDGVIILHVLEHISKVAKAARELLRVLQPGGFIEHETPCCMLAAIRPYACALLGI
jgi:ubiquinone/menaquinone biosynthesis C-methylase UbiE